MSSVAVASSFTNHAGHAVSGRLTAITNGTAVIAGRAYPLSVFPASEQERMLALLKVPNELPAPLANLRRSIRERCLRGEALLKAGAKSPESAAAQRAQLESAWLRALDSAPIDSASRAYWKAHLFDVAGE